MLAGIGAVLVGAGASWALLGWALIFLAVVSTLGRLVIIPSSVRAWSIGAEGEESTARALEPLVAEGFRVLHDRLIPETRANIDHIVIGPTGIFVVETKNHSGAVRVRGGELFIDGRRKPQFVEQITRQVSAVRAALDGADVGAILCVHRVSFPLIGSRSFRGIPIVSARDLPRILRNAPARLGRDEIDRLARSADERLRRAA